VGTTGCNVRGVVLCHDLPHLSHLGVRARQEGVVFATCVNGEEEAKVRAFAGKQVTMATAQAMVRFGISSSAELEAQARTGGTRAVGSVTTQRGAAPLLDRCEPGTVLPVTSTAVAQGGAKSAVCGILDRAAADSGGLFKVPRGVCFPFGSLEGALDASGRANDVNGLMQVVETADIGPALDDACAKLQAIVQGLRPTQGGLDTALKLLGGKGPFIVRSSANVEDLEGLSGAGLYDSIPNVPAVELGEAVAAVWASLYTRRAVLSRRAAGIPQSEASMAVLVQRLVAPDYSFVLHTVDPTQQTAGVEAGMLVELTPGHGETLASGGVRGTPWRLRASRDGSAAVVETLAFASFSEALFPCGPSGLQSRVVDYSKESMSDSVQREDLGRRLSSIGLYLENTLSEGGKVIPQDVEGCLVGKDVYIVQSRPQ